MNQRLERVGRLIREEISDILRREIHDPLIGFVTITECEVSPDLRFARVFFSVLGDDEQVEASTKGLLRARKWINARLAERIDLRFVPKIRLRPGYHCCPRSEAGAAPAARARGVPRSPAGR